MAIRNKVGEYGKKRVLGEAVKSGWNTINSSVDVISKERVATRGDFRTFWNGPATDELGREIYAQNVAPFFESREHELSVAKKLFFMSLLIIMVSFVSGISTLFVTGFITKLSTILTFLIFSGVAVSQYHRSQQIKRQRIFGLKELFSD